MMKNMLNNNIIKYNVTLLHVNRIRVEEAYRGKVAKY